MKQTLQDRNFDTLVEKFEKKIYHTRKGDWRLKLLKEDLNQFYHSEKMLTVWDAGCGFAQISLWLAAQGHHLTLCDLSQKMLQRAEQKFSQTGITAQFYHQAAQTLAPHLPQFDLVLFHAVLEWMAEPQPGLRMVANKVKTGGYLSLLFYNRNAMVYNSTLKGGWRWQNILNDSYMGKGSKLTPPNPQYPHEVLDLLKSLGFSIAAHTGIRVFHDYLRPDAFVEGSEKELFELEYRYCRTPTYRDMGRYIHLLAQRQK